MERGGLAVAVDRVSVAARRSGALMPIATVGNWIEDGGVRFLVRRGAGVAQKSRRPLERPAANPFLPYDPALFVADVSPTHVCLLNKFAVIDRHLLIVTRRFEDQEALLTAADVAALAACLAEIDGLGFYNGGAVAGASQPHKHLQLVPLPLADEGPRVPIEPLLAAAGPARAVGTVPGLPLRHAFIRLDPALFDDAHAAAAGIRERYRALIAAVGIGAVAAAGGERQSAPYNLLVTRSWMLVVPRSREAFATISVNALGFAGSLFVRDAAELGCVTDHGPMTVLRHVATG